MVKRALVITVAIVLLGSAFCFVFACTSFAVYSGRTLYGMNFDDLPRGLRFALEERCEHSPLTSTASKPGSSTVYIKLSFGQGKLVKELPVLRN